MPSLLAENELKINFTNGSIYHRTLRANLKNELIARAIGLKKNFRPQVLDTTAGLGQDSFILASLGCIVFLIERCPKIYKLLQQAIKKTKKDPKLTEICKRLCLIFGDSINILNKLTQQDAENKTIERKIKITNLNVNFENFLDENDCIEDNYYTSDHNYIKPDVIYIDPMFPLKTKTAANKKNMRLLKEITGYDYDADNLLKKALKYPVKRIVVKRPRKADHLAQLAPNFSITGKACRFDVYINFIKA